MKKLLACVLPLIVCLGCSSITEDKTARYSRSALSLEEKHAIEENFTDLKKIWESKELGASYTDGYVESMSESLLKYKKNIGSDDELSDDELYASVLAALESNFLDNLYLAYITESEREEIAEVVVGIKKILITKKGFSLGDLEPSLEIYNDLSRRAAVLLYVMDLQGDSRSVMYKDFMDSGILDKYDFYDFYVISYVENYKKLN